jgi:membrane-associated protease RseP (regulator of RpoE activity)
MPDEFFSDEYYKTLESQKRKQGKNKIFLHLGLFIITFITTTIAGADWTTGYAGSYLNLDYVLIGLPYSISILFIISCHEFGPYFAAKYHKAEATLPYYIPFPPIPFFINFGTMGAVIRTKSPIKTKAAMFDIGVAGPIAGFIACLIVLIYGFLTVPGVEYILKVHPDYFSPEYGKNALSFEFGNTLLFSFLKLIFANHQGFFPPMSEIYHYPFLCVGWFGLFITAMNMIPVGQLDGGHISYTMFGDKLHYNISVVSFLLLFVTGLFGFVDSVLELNLNIGWSGWLFWSLVLYFIIKLKHPPIPDNDTLDNRRMILGYISYFIFTISFSFNPIILSVG